MFCCFFFLGKRLKPTGSQKSEKESSTHPVKPIYQVLSNKVLSKKTLDFVNLNSAWFPIRLPCLFLLGVHCVGVHWLCCYKLSGMSLIFGHFIKLKTSSSVANFFPSPLSLCAV